MPDRKYHYGEWTHITPQPSWCGVTDDDVGETVEEGVTCAPSCRECPFWTGDEIVEASTVYVGKVEDMKPQSIDSMLMEPVFHSKHMERRRGTDAQEGLAAKWAAERRPGRRGK